MTGNQVKIKTALISNEEQKDTVQMSGHSLLYQINMYHFPTFYLRPFLNIHNHVYDDLCYHVDHFLYLHMSMVFLLVYIVHLLHLHVSLVIYVIPWTISLYPLIIPRFPLWFFFCQQEMNWFTTSFPKLNRQNTWKEYQKSYIRSVTVYITKHVQLMQFDYSKRGNGG
jgi:hypothetical protein